MTFRIRLQNFTTVADSWIHYHVPCHAAQATTFPHLSPNPRPSFVVFLFLKVNQNFFPFDVCCRLQVNPLDKKFLRRNVIRDYKWIFPRYPNVGIKCSKPDQMTEAVFNEAGPRRTFHSPYLFDHRSLSIPLCWPIIDFSLRLPLFLIPSNLSIIMAFYKQPIIVKLK